MAGIQGKISLLSAVSAGLFFAAFVLLVEPPLDSSFDHPSLTAPTKVKGKDNRQWEQAGSVILEDQQPSVHPSLLRFDYKQNLLLWPVLAGEIARSPPTLFQARS
jgi:hypothetical protein